jgi:hypothetical protein
MKCKTVLGSLLGAGSLMVSVGITLDQMQYSPLLNKHHAAAQPYIAWIEQERAAVKTSNNIEEITKRESMIITLKKNPAMAAYEGRAQSLSNWAMCMGLPGMLIAAVSLSGLMGLYNDEKNKGRTDYWEPPTL